MSEPAAVKPDQAPGAVKAKPGEVARRGEATNPKSCEAKRPQHEKPNAEDSQRANKAYAEGQRGHAQSSFTAAGVQNRRATMPSGVEGPDSSLQPPSLDLHSNNTLDDRQNRLKGQDKENQLRKQSYMTLSPMQSGEGQSRHTRAKDNNRFNRGLQQPKYNGRPQRGSEQVRNINRIGEGTSVPNLSAAEALGGAAGERNEDRFGVKGKSNDVRVSQIVRRN